MVQQIHGWKFFGWVQKDVGSKNCLSKKFGLEIKFAEIFFWLIKHSVSKDILCQKIVCQKKFD